MLKPIFPLRKLVGYERVYSDKLEEVLLKGMLPKMFRPAAEEPQKPPYVILWTTEQVAEVVRRLSPPSKAAP